MYESLRIIKGVKPKFVIWENVKNLLSDKHIHNFNNYLEAMESLGYINYYKVLNAKDYGIPQNRERVFTVSIRNDLKQGYDFPKPKELTIKLKDLLEENVDEKYFLSDKMLNCFLEDGTGNYPRRERFLQNINRKNQNIGNSITTRAGSRPTDNFIFDSNKTICLNPKGGRGGVEGLQPSRQDRVYSANGILPTLTTSLNPNIAIDKTGNEINLYSNNKQLKETIENNELKNGEVKSLDLYNRTANTLSQTLTEPHHNSQRLYDGLRIRKLTPLECFRLMGFWDKDFYKAKATGMSDAQLYKQAGNSIVVDVLVNIFYNLFNNVAEKKEQYKQLTLF